MPKNRKVARQPCCWAIQPPRAMARIMPMCGPIMNRLMAIERRSLG
jgi:hypothetical protein